MVFKSRGSFHGVQIKRFIAWYSKQRIKFMELNPGFQFMLSIKALTHSVKVRFINMVSIVVNKLINPSSFIVVSTG